VILIVIVIVIVILILILILLNISAPSGNTSRGISATLFCYIEII
jgi:preprotein translocase subunit SecG